MPSFCPRRRPIATLLLCLCAAVVAHAQDGTDPEPPKEAGRGVPVLPAPKPAPKLRVEKLSASCYAVTQAEGKSNAGFVVGERGVLVVDSFESRAHAEALLGEIRRVTKKPIAYLVLTHSHYDHSVGNQAFPTSVPVLAAPAAAARLAERLKADRLLLSSAAGMHSTLDIGKVRAVTQEVDGQHSIDLGGVVVQLSVAGDCHSRGDLVALVAAEKVLFAGDLVWNGLHPNISGGSTFAWITALAHLGRVDVEKVVPGHGAAGGKELLAAQRNYLMTLRKLVKHLLKRKVSAADIIRKLDVPSAYADLEFVEWWRTNIRFVYQEFARAR